MNISSLSELFSNKLNHQVFNLRFPDYTKGEFIKLELNSGVEEVGGVLDFNIQFSVKAEHPSKAEALALEIIYKLNGITNEEFCGGTYQLILLRATSPVPFYLGVSENDEYVYTVDFRVLATRL